MSIKRYRTGMKNYRKLVLLGVVLVAGVLAMMGGCRPKVPPAPTDPPPVNVKTKTIEPVSQLADTFVLPGVLEPSRVVDVSAEVAGRIEELQVGEGQAVDAGQLLVRLNTELLKAEHDRATAQAEFDQREYERTQQAQRSGVATGNEVDTARTTAAGSQATLALARANLERAQIIAPISGILDNLPVEKGEYLKVGDLIARIVDLDTVKVRVDVPERDVAYLTKGQQAEAIVNGGHTVTGEITYISELADILTRTSPIEITIDNPEHNLRSGQIARVRLTRRVLESAIMVPLEAVIPLEDGREVYVVEDSKAQPRKVELGLLKGSSVQIVSGLQPGDQLIVTGQRFVGPGQAVRVVEQVAAKP